MISFPFIKDLNTNILSKSKAIKGRFYLCPQSGMEINTGNLGELLKEIVIPVDANKYPLALMMPPTGYGNYTDPNGEWELYRFIMFFLKQTFNQGSGQVADINVDTQTSKHSVIDDWHDMKRCAINYLRILNRFTREKGLVKDKLRLENSQRSIQPVSMIGADRVSGVMLTYGASIMLDCELEDYNEQDISTITIPADDSHPEHEM